MLSAREPFSSLRSYGFLKWGFLCAVCLYKVCGIVRCYVRFARKLSCVFMCNLCRLFAYVLCGMYRYIVYENPFHLI